MALPPDILWRPEDLGKPIGGSPHAISACLPTWEHVVGYEEGDPAVIQALQCGYPRFFIHPYLRELASRELMMKGWGDSFGLIFGGESSARRAQKFLQQGHSITCRIAPVDTDSHPAWILAVPENMEKAARFYWRVSGEGLSSRGAEAILRNKPDQKNIRQEKLLQICQLLAGEHGTDPGDVFIFPSGMAAIYALIRAVESLRPESTHLQIGFPYVDTWKDLKQFTSHPELLVPVGNNHLVEFFRNRKSESLGLVLSECPSNPLLETPDPEILRSLCDQSGAVLAIDDTIASSVNIQALPYADAVTTSLSKWVNGKGDLLAGAVILNPHQPNYRSLKEEIESQYCPELVLDDLQHLVNNAADYRNRVQLAGRNTSHLIPFLQSHPGIARIFSADPEKSPAYQKLIRHNSHPPGLLSLLIDPSWGNPATFYNALKISKGPSLGTDWSLACPYTLLAHYDELDWVESCGVSRQLIRLSVGLENSDDLKERLDQALHAARI